MNTTFQKETLYDVVHEIDELLRLHYEELCLNKDKVKLDPGWQKYAALEAAGCFHIFTARKDGKLIGYSAFFIQPHLHYSELMVANNDVLFLHPQERGSIGLRLINYSEERIVELKQPNQHLKIVMRAKLNTTLQRLLPKIGYAIEEQSFGKIL